MKRTFALLSVAALLLVAASVRAAAPAKPTIIPASALKWTADPDIKGTYDAALYGDPTKAGAEFAYRFKIPDGLKIAPHFHGRLSQETVISGTFMVGLGKKWDASKLKALPAGSYIAMPANVPHFGTAKGETVVEIHGIGPDTTTLIK